jgi:hypothetical protein
MLVGKLRKTKVEKWNDKNFDYSEVDIESPDGKNVSFRVFPDSDEHGGEDIYILPVLEVLRKEKHKKRNVCGLLLLPTGNKKGEYTRVGFFDLSAFDEDYQKIQEQFLKLAELSGKATAEAQCAEILSEPECPDKRYVITII